MTKSSYPYFLVPKVVGTGTTFEVLCGLCGTPKEIATLPCRMSIFRRPGRVEIFWRPFESVLFFESLPGGRRRRSTRLRQETPGGTV